jgi:hypothetical protein
VWKGTRNKHRERRQDRASRRADHVLHALVGVSVVGLIGAAGFVQTSPDPIIGTVIAIHVEPDVQGKRSAPTGTKWTWTQPGPAHITVRGDDGHEWTVLMDSREARRCQLSKPYHLVTGCRELLPPEDQR